MRPHRLIPIFPLLGFSLVAVLVPAHAQAPGLRAAIVSADITPVKPVMMTGYDSRKGLSQGVHDPLAARVAAFDRGGHRLVLVSLDNCGFYNDTLEPFRSRILRTCRLEPSELFLCATHTHSGPTLTLDPAKGHSNNVEYTQTLLDQLTGLTKKALSQTAPCQIGTGSGASPVGANRREVAYNKDGSKKIVLGRNPWLLTDREVQVVKLTRTDRPELAGVLFTYATHSTSLGAKNHTISGDVHGLAEQFVEKYLGGQVVAAGFAGASGNIDPWFRVLPAFNTTNGWIPEPVLLGTLLGEEAANVLAKIETPRPDTPVNSAMKTLQLPGKPRTDQVVPDGSLQPFTVSVGRVGEVAVVGLGGEVFNEIGRAIKDGSPFPVTLVITHCNGAAGYLPTRARYPDGGYEIRSSRFAPGADELLTRDTLAMLRELKDAAK
jgi:neutral ceramidase